jgi:hypothetical protein
MSGMNPAGTITLNIRAMHNSMAIKRFDERLRIGERLNTAM